MIFQKFLKPTTLALLAFSFTFVACSDDDENTTPTPEPLNIVETALETAELSSLVAALQAADGDLVTVGLAH